MKVLVVLSLMLIQQVAIANYHTVSVPQRLKLRVIFGGIVEYRLSTPTRHLIKAGHIPPVTLGVANSRNWKEIIAHIDQTGSTADALADIAQSPKHLEEAKELLIELYGEDHGGHQYERLVDVSFVRSQFKDIKEDLKQNLPVTKNGEDYDYTPHGDRERELMRRKKLSKKEQRRLAKEDEHRRKKYRKELASGRIGY